MIALLNLFNRLFHMDGYAIYVWSAYGLAFSLLIIYFFIGNRRFHLTQKKLWQKYYDSPT